MPAKKILFIFGTRPEAIKMAPLIKEFNKHPQKFELKICVTAQHRKMLDQVLDFFEIVPDYDLNIMRSEQTLFNVTIDSLKGLENILEQFTPDLIFVQGDTTTVLTGALAGFYKKIAVVHLEAGLRSGNKNSPFPEELNRILASQIATYHLAPTQLAVDNLKKENINKNIYLVGNTVIDALLLGLEIIKQKGESSYQDFFKFINFSKKIILVTGHRRESFGQPFENFCSSLAKLAQREDLEIVYPVHLNPNVQRPVKQILQNFKNIHLIEPLDYPYLIWLMAKSYLVITDSGGIQEEAPTLGKPVLVTREITERTEGVLAGTARLVGTNKETILAEASLLLDDKLAYQKMAQVANPYGDGKASKRIAAIFIEQ